MMHADPLSGVPVFPEKRKGYDQATVDQYVHALQIQLTDAQTRLVEAEDQMRRAALDVQPSDSESAATLQAAKQIADETITDAKTRAQTALDEARDRAAQILEDAQERMEHARGVNEKIEQMKSETTAYVADAERHVQAIRAAASEEAIALKEEAIETARSTREDAELHASEVRRKADADAVALRNDARDQIAQAKIAIREAEDRVIVAAKERAETIEADAEMAAGNTITEAREQASMMVEDAEQAAERTTNDAMEAAHERLSEAAAAGQQIVAEARERSAAEARESKAELETQLLALAEQRETLGRSIDGQRSVILGQREALTSAIEEMQHVLEDTLSDAVLIDLSSDDGSGDRDELVAEMLDNSL